MAVSSIRKIFDVQAIQHKVLLHCPIGTFEELVKHVVITLMSVESHHTRLFEKIPINESSGDGSGTSEFYPDEFSKTR